MDYYEDFSPGKQLSVEYNLPVTYNQLIDQSDLVRITLQTTLDLSSLRDPQTYVFKNPKTVVLFQTLIRDHHDLIGVKILTEDYIAIVFTEKIMVIDVRDGSRQLFFYDFFEEEENQMKIIYQQFDKSQWKNLICRPDVHMLWDIKRKILNLLVKVRNQNTAPYYRIVKSDFEPLHACIDINEIVKFIGVG